MRCTPTRCSPKPALAKRELLTVVQAEELAKLFSILAGATRLRLLHALLRSGEMCTTELANSIGMKAQAVSNQLRSLVHQGIIEDRRDGPHVYYRIIDPCVASLLDLGLCLNEDARQGVHRTAKR